MNRVEKENIINGLAEKINKYSHFYLADTAELNAEATSDLRRKCFENEIGLVVAKNTLIKLALDKAEGEYTELYDTLKGATSIMFCDANSAPGKLIKEFRKAYKKPILKGAYVEETVYIGDDQLDALATIKSKDELIGELIGLLQSPAKNVLSALQSSGGKLAGIVKTLSERE